MGTYKVPQNVEAEDKILGPLSMKQFIYAMIGVGYGFLTFAIFKSVPILFVIIGLPPTLFMLALGLYQKEDQPFEAFFVAVLHFILSPRKRYWEKEPIAQVFRVDPPPPKPQEIRRDPREVRGQLQRLANVVDTRGWNIKQSNVQEPEMEPVIDLQDRLGAAQVIEHLPTGPAVDVPIDDVTPNDDILDVNNAAAANLNVLMEDTIKNIRQEAQQKMQKVPHPRGAKATPGVSQATPKPANPDTANAIMKLANEGGDLTIAQIANQAKRTQGLVEGQAINLRGAV